MKWKFFHHKKIFLHLKKKIKKNIGVNLLFCSFDGVEDEWRWLNLGKIQSKSKERKNEIKKKKKNKSEDENNGKKKIEKKK